MPLREGLPPFIPQKQQGMQQKSFYFFGIYPENKELRILNVKFLFR